MPTSWTSPPPLQTTHPITGLTKIEAAHMSNIMCDKCGFYFDTPNHYYACVTHSTGVSQTPASPTGEDWGKAETRVTDPETGAQKGRKPQEYALIPVQALASIAEVYGYGATKYAPDNWRKGYAWSLSYSALQRHLNAFWGGEETDPESGLPHLAHAGFHILSLLTFASGEQYTAKDDRA